MDDARARRFRRARVFRLGEERDDLPRRTTAAERLAMVWPLTVEAWTLAGLPLPDYARADMPVRVTRRASPGDPGQERGAG